MSETEVVSETVAGPCLAPCGDSGPIQVEMQDTLGVIALAVVSLLLLMALRQELAPNRPLARRLLGQAGWTSRVPGSTIPICRRCKHADA